MLDYNRHRARHVRHVATVDAVPVIALHPGIADDYRRQVQALHEALHGTPPNWKPCRSFGR
jgi:hypothetical protein